MTAGWERKGTKGHNGHWDGKARDAFANFGPAYGWASPHTIGQNDKF